MKKHYLVFREEPLTRTQIGHRQEHNEREADCYANGNIDLARIKDNIYFKKPTGDYMEMVQKRIDAGELSAKGLQQDAAYFSEIIVGVNSDYWTDKDEAYKRKFFQAVYNHLVKKFGEENVISCVWHRDEIFDGKINEHIHFVAVPVVSKKRYYSKRSKQYQELLQTEGRIKATDDRLLKGIEKQISHSKFFSSSKDEKHRIIYSYTLYQDDLIDDLKAAGFKDIARGITGQSGVRHLSPLQYKAVMERLESRAKDIMPEIQAEDAGDGKIVMDEQSYESVMELNQNAAKQTAAYGEAVDVYIQEQKMLTEKKNEIYQVALEQSKLEFDELQYRQLQEQAKRLKEENQMLKDIISIVKRKVQALVSCFQNIIDSWIVLRTDKHAHADSVMAEIDNHIRTGIKILNDEQSQGIVAPVK